jgi:hypothetical protein
MFFLTGGQDSVAKLFAALGVSYARDAANGQFIHPAAAAVIATDGRVIAWLSTLALDAGDLQTALAAAQARQPVSFSQFIVNCFHGIGPVGLRTPSVMLALRVSAALGLIVFAALVWRLRRHGVKRS